MKSIIRATTILLCLVLATATLLAQGPRHRGPAPLGQLIDRHAEELGLSDDQLTQLTELDAATRARLETLRADEALPPEDRQAATREILRETQATLATILTAEQQQQLRELRPERRDRQRPDPAQREAMREGKEALHTAVKAYRAENIEPVLRAQRQKLETRISADDRATLDRLRTQLAAAKAEREAARDAVRQARAAGDRPPDATDREKRKAAFAEGREQKQANRQAMQAELDPLLARYDAAITTLLAEITDQRASWQTDLRAIHEQDAPAEGTGRTRHRRARSPRRGGDDAGAGKADRPDRKEMSKAQFLLMDAAAEAPAEAASAPRNTISLYPNPAVSGETVATLRILRAGPVRVELRTENGRVLKVIADTQYPAGEHPLPISTQGLRPGVYYLSLSDAAGVRTERLVVN